MEVIVTDNKKNTITYGYAPEHYAGVVEFYSNLVQRGEIYTYTVKV
jgi:type II secretory pathway component PulC